MKYSALFVLFAFLAGCSHNQRTETYDRIPANGEAQSRVGIVVIDVQKSFVLSAANDNIPTVLANIKHVFQLAEETQTPFFITYEDNQSGDHDISDDLKKALPRQHRDFIKTTYAATGLPSFAKAIKESGLTHFIILGSETDVCIMQTAMGLRKLGFQVLLQKDAIFSSEPNITPALRRMAAAGIGTIEIDGVKNLLKSKSPPESTTIEENSIINPLANGRPNVALVLNLFDESHLAGSDDRFKREKLQRLRELLLVSEWLQVPTYLVGENSKSFSLPASVRKITGAQALQHLNKKKWLSFKNFPRAQFAQVVVAGLDQGLDQVVIALGKSRQVFIMEDALLSAPSIANLAGGKNGLVPLTYKSFFYGMIKSITWQEWPSKAWGDRSFTFYPLTEAPEKLDAIRTPGT